METAKLAVEAIKALPRLAAMVSFAVIRCSRAGRDVNAAERHVSLY